MLEVNIVSVTYQTCQKRRSGIQKWAILFCQFWFCAICETTKSYLTFKSIPPKTISKILSVEGISVFISQKLRKLEQNNILRFFCPRKAVCFSNFLSKKISFQKHSNIILCLFIWDPNEAMIHLVPPKYFVTSGVERIKRKESGEKE